MKRLFLLTAAMALFALSRAQLAVGDIFEYDSVFYHVLSDSTVETFSQSTYERNMLGLYDRTPYEYTNGLAIPASFDYQDHTFTVVGIGDYSFGYLNSTPLISLPSTIRYIGDFAFYLCDGLQSFTIPESVDSIGEKALAIDSYTITTLTLPYSVHHMNPMAMVFNGKVQAIDVDRNNPYFCSVDGVLYTKDTTCLLTYPIAKGGDVYTVHDSVKTIGPLAFFDCHLKIVHLPSGLNYIDEAAFGNCKQLQEIELPASVRLSPVNPFMTCEKIDAMRVNPNNPYYEMRGNYLYSKTGDTLLCMMTTRDTTRIPEGTRVIGTSLFEKYVNYGNEENVRAFIIPEGVETIMDSAFAHRSRYLTYIRLPESLRYIGKEAFRENFRLTRINLPSGLKYIGDYAFFWIYNISSCFNVLPDSLEYIGDYVFGVTKVGTNLKFGGKLRHIGAHAFSSWGNIGSEFSTSLRLDFPPSLKYIGEKAFAYHDANVVYFNGDVDTIESRAFYAKMSADNHARHIDRYYYLHNVTPPYIGADAFLTEDENCTIYVPCGALDNYLSDTAWAHYTDVLRENCDDPGVGIEEAPTEKPSIEIHTEGLRLTLDGIEGQAVQIYDASGRLMLAHAADGRPQLWFNLPSAGLYIIHAAGQTHKVVVR
ncbi:MAG: leucine-rich repeat domain-containing protein [Bacteroidales bacterium]|nr:leucine-rich repeat domain-containing protein [Bacteroidales bacterium]